jgi:hypothetical protein
LLTTFLDAQNVSSLFDEGRIAVTDRNRSQLLENHVNRLVARS